MEFVGSRIIGFLSRAISASDDLIPSRRVTRHAEAAITAVSMNETDRNDARSLAQLVRSGWFKSVD